MAGAAALASTPALLNTLNLFSPRGAFAMSMPNLPLPRRFAAALAERARSPLVSSPRGLPWRRAPLLALLLALPAAGWAQEVFVTRGAGGTVYSDKPQSGGKALSLPPLNVVEPVPVAKESAVHRAPDEAARPVAAAPAYRRFSIVSPQDNGSVAANSALFDVRVALDPPLQLGAGHAIVVSVNGQPVGQRFTASEFTIPPEFWGDTLPAGNQRYQLDAAIVDRGGEVLKNAPPVTFIVRYIVGAYPPPWYGPGHRPRPKPLPVDQPRPNPPPAQPFDPWEKKFDQQGLRFYQR